MFLFWVKKFIEFWVMPVPFCFLLICAGWWLTRRTERVRLGRWLIGLAIALLLIFSNKFVSTALVHPLEAVYPPIPELAAGKPLPANLAACRYIVVLGGGNGEIAGVAAINRLSASARARVTEAVRLGRMLPKATLVFSGPGQPGHPSNAEVQAEAAISLGIDRSRIRLIEDAHDTEDESMATKKIVGDAPFALVTSAWHMPRSMALMHHAQAKALPCPTDYGAMPPPHRTWDDYLWDLDSLNRSTMAIKERLGYLWIWMRGKT